MGGTSDDMRDFRFDCFIFSYECVTRLQVRDHETRLWVEVVADIQKDSCASKNGSDYI